MLKWFWKKSPQNDPPLAAIFILACLVCLAAPKMGHAAALTIFNKTDREIINILAMPRSEKEDFFIRLDLPPGEKAQVENPGGQAELRADTGLELLYFGNVLFNGVKLLTFSDAASPKLLVDYGDGHSSVIAGKSVPLVPGKGERPVCELDHFRPNMPMRDVCKIIPGNTPLDDNGAYLTGLGFGGLAWAGRLGPEHAAAPENALLEHMELRRPFVAGDIYLLLNHLFQQGYVPWQAEFPDAELDFADMPDKNPADRRKSLLDVLNRYLENLPRQSSQASIMLAPADILDALANADAPERDVQLFTLLLKPKLGTFMLDVSAYRGSETK